MNRNHHPPTISRRLPIPAKSPSNPNWKPNFRRHHRYDRPPPPSPPPLYGAPRLFKVDLRSSNRPLTTIDLDDLISTAGTLPEATEILPSGHLARLAYRRWIDALEATVSVWRTRLQGQHLFTPWLLPSACDMNKLWEKLNDLFTEHVRALIDGESVQKWRRKLRTVCDELGGVQGLMRKHNKLSVYEELVRKKARLETEKGLIEQRVSEFVSSTNPFTPISGPQQIDLVWYWVCCGGYKNVIFRSKKLIFFVLIWVWWVFITIPEWLMLCS